MEIDLGNFFKKALGIIRAAIKKFFSIRDKKVSAEIEEKAKKKIDALSYNKERENIARRLEEVRSFVIDETIDITNITYFAKIQAALSEVLSYETLLTAEEIDKLKNNMIIIKDGRIDEHDRKDIIECLNYFIYKLKRSDIVV